VPAIDPSKQLDDQVQAQLSRLCMGLSPIALGLAAADWAMHLAASPGKQMALAHKAVELSREAVQRSLTPAHPETRKKTPVSKTLPGRSGLTAR
jgi:polyhydroxyalkanoate synthase